MEFIAFVAGAVLLAAAPLAAAQNATAPKLPVHTSAFEGYEPYREEKRSDWRDLNDTVRVPGAHMREMPAQEKPVDPHAGHTMAAPKPPAPAIHSADPRAPHDMKHMGGTK